MKDLRPKIKKVLIETLDAMYGSSDYTVYEKDDHIRLKENNPDDFTKKRGWDDQELAMIPEYDHQDAFCFLCDGGMLWDLMNPSDADYPNCEFYETIRTNFEKAGLFLECHASWRFDISLDQ